MRVAGVIFDFDGTLADTIPVCCAAFRAAARQFTGREYSDADIIAMFGPSEEGILRSLAGERLETAMATFLATYEREHARCPDVFPGVRRLLDSLSESGVRLGLVTGKGSRSAAISLRLLGLAERFDPVETGSPDGGVKPEAIRRVLDRWGLPASEVAYVGDAPSDMRDARASGTIPLAAAWAATADIDALERAQPCALFRSVGEMQAWFDRQAHD